MNRYEYEVTIKGDKKPTSNKKKLVVEQTTEHLVRIILGDNDAAIVSFLPEGIVRIYRGTAEDAGFKPEIY